MKLIGNTDIWEQLSLAKYSAMKDNRPLPHTLLSGAAGCGKTSTARELARQSHSQFLSVSPDAIKTRDDVLAIIDILDRKGYDKYGNVQENVKINHPVVFVDEIHRISPTGQEHLGIVMEEWKIPVDGSNAKENAFSKFAMKNKISRRNKPKNMIRWSPKFTLIGATTNDGILTGPFKDRFKMRFNFNTYTLDESIEIVKYHAERLNIGINNEAAKEIALRGRGVPRILVGLLERCRDFAIANDKRFLDANLARGAFLLFKIDDTGMTEVDVKILKALYSAESPLGIDNLAIIVNESRKTISDTIEPYLVRRAFINRTPRGRTLTESGEEYLIKGGYIEVDTTEEEWVDIPSDYVRRL